MALPGQVNVNGTSNFIFGTNMAQDFSPNNVRNNASIQAEIAAGGFTLMRCAIPSSSPDSYIDETVAACAACGCQMLVILSHSNLTWNTHLVTYLGSNCNLYELGNEPDLGGISWQQYLTYWNQQIPALSAINTNAAFIGPVLGDFAHLNSYLVPWLQGCVSSGVIPDAISFHIYPCTGGNNAPWCAGRAGNFAQCAAQVDAAVIGVLGHKLPNCLTEWNIDATNPPASYCTQKSFVTPWLHTALDSMVQGGYAMACQFDAGSGAAGGADDLVNVSNFQPTVEYQPIVDKITQYLGGGGGGGGSPDNNYGTTIGTTVASGTFPSQAIVDIQNLGITWLRYSIPWDHIDTTGTTTQNPSTYIWNAWDSAVSQANAAGINIILTIFGAPSQFIDGGTPGNPLDPTYTAVFAGQIATRYDGTHGHGTIQAIECGSEDYDQGSSQPAGPLVDTLKTVYPAVKAVSSSIKVICAALLQRNATHYTSFMETLLNPATGAYTSGVFQADVLTYHYYTGIPDSGSPNYTPVNLDPTVDIPSWNGGQGLPSVTHAWQLIQAKKVAYGLTIPTWITETGFQINTNPTRHPSDTVSQALQWQYLQAVLDSARASGGEVTKVFPFTFGYYDGYGSPNYRDGMSLVQGPLSSPVYTTAYNGLNTYIATYPNWSGGGGGGGSNLVVYFANAASGILGTADQLYQISGSPSTTWTYTRVGTTVNKYIELTSQGTTTVTSYTSLPAPTGNGSFLDGNVLNGQTISAGAWAAATRLNCAQGGDGNPQAGSLTADIIVRISKYNAGVYTTLVIMRLNNQGIPSAFTNFALPNTNGNAIAFGPYDHLYIDRFVNITANGNGSSIQDIRTNRLSTDTSGFTGDPTSSVTTPGFAPTGGGGGGGGGSGTILLTDAGLNLLRDGEAGTNIPKITYVALGTSTAPPTNGDTQLGAEVFRKAVTTYTDGATGEITTIMFLSPNDSNGITIEEVGFFGGSATGQANSGTLFGRALYHKAKNNQISITFPLDIQFTRG